MAAPVGHLLAHPTGRFLFQNRGSEIDVYVVDERRNPPLTLLFRVNGDPRPVAVEEGYLEARAAVIDPSGRFLFGAGPDGIWGYAVDAQSGNLRSLGILAAGAFDRPVVVRRP